MPRRKYAPEEIVAKLRQVDVLLGQEKTVGKAVRSIGVTETTYRRWRDEYGGLKLDQVKRLKELEAESSCLRRAVSDLTLGKMILNEAPREKIRRRCASPITMRWSRHSRRIEPIGLSA